MNKEAYEKCKNAIEAVGLKGFEDRIIGTLSGGQLQRCLFARVILQDQQIILLDEPFSAIDNQTLIDLTELIKGWHASNHTVVLVTHDPEEAMLMGDRIALMRDGKIIQIPAQ